MSDQPPLPWGGPTSLEVALMDQAWQRWSTAPPLRVEISRQALWLILGSVQMSATAGSAVAAVNPEFPAALIELGRQIQAVVCDTPDLYTIAERGWPRPSA